MKYSFLSQFRAILILLKNSINNPLISFYSSVWFGINFMASFGRQRICILKARNGTKLFIRTNSSDLEVLIQHIAYKELFHQEILSLSPSCILDAGSNIGISIFVFSSIFPNAKILAIEPDPENFQILEKLTQSLPQEENITLIQAALFNEDAMDLALTKVPGMEYSSSVRKGEIGNISGIKFESLKEKYGLTPDLIKLDIEGSEIDLMRDEQNFISMMKNKDLLIELHGATAYLDFFHLLKKNNITNVIKVGEYWMVNGKSYKSNFESII